MIRTVVARRDAERNAKIVTDGNSGTEGVEFGEVVVGVGKTEVES